MFKIVFISSVTFMLLDFNNGSDFFSWVLQLKTSLPLGGNNPFNLIT